MQICYTISVEIDIIFDQFLLKFFVNLHLLH
ncbi:MAG: hypothetical protein UX53_C0033G0005 [Candidatus Azambacteria bacterium GW2011_GWB2_46_37]|uniref:Uncharacterized protein n=1 Tax=Candidatus Azambacteria bacterium GW2011_GWB2_46_37 TaxID=1618618 RepID=A0A0G1Q0H7_9BACT|nr:MAG: hypothetical protein UX53_C0033G0005 [Candidatus Azambacteria bacterium GW2011_GWB2_46_37]